MSPVIDTYPHSPEIEAALLGAILINPNAWLEVSDLPAAAFYIERHRFVWQAYQRLAQAGMTLNDLELLADDLSKAGHLDDVGGVAGLMKFIGLGNSFSAPDYARSLAEYHLRRKLILAAGQITQSAYDLSADTLELLTSAIDKVRGAGEGLETDKDESLGNLFSRMYDGILDRTQNGANALSRHIPSPWVGINSFLADGFKPGKLYVVAARPGEGKSTWLTNVAFHAAQNGSRVMFYSLEMEGLEVAARILAAQTNMSANLLTDGVVDTEEGWENLLQGIETAGNAALWIRYTPRLTPEKLRAMAHKAKMEHGMEMLVVDYLQLMRGDGKTVNRQEEVATISRELKILAGELDVPVLVAAQLNREVEKRAEKDPQLSDLRESGAIENDADVVMFLARPKPENNESVAKFDKNRSGKTGKTGLLFQAAQFRFVEAEAKNQSYPQKRSN